MLLSHKVAVITGAKGGIGLATAARFAAEGATVVIVDVEDASAEARMLGETGATARFIRADIGDQAQASALFEEVESEFGRVDVVVVHLSGTDFSLAGRCAKAAVPVMARTGGVIVNLAGETSNLDELTRVLAAEHASHGIRVNALCSEAIDTQPLEVTSACAKLASDECSYMTGETLVLGAG